MKAVALPLALATFAGIAGCASQAHRFQLASDMYVLFVDDKGTQGNIAELQKRAVSDAEAFARNKGEEVLPVTLYGAPVPIENITTVSYLFRLIPPGSSKSQSSPAATPGEIPGHP